MEGDVPVQLQRRWNQLQDLAHGTHDLGDTSLKLGLECLVDSFIALFDECQQGSLSRNQNIAAFLKKYCEAVKKAKELQIKPSDFEVKAIIGRGHFGEVHVVHERTTDTVYAMKVLRKSDLLSQPDISFFEEERNIMGGCSSPWLTKLHFAFQDSVNLYLIMDFHPGGDLLSLLSRHGDQLEEDMTRFYLAEMAVAINDLHQMGFLHRDIKPENILLDHTGHIKLADFGSAARMNSKMQVSSRMPVGTPDYVAPELLDSMNRASQNQKYGVEVDWWSLGICAYEMLFGCTPFTDEEGSMVATYGNIMNFKNKLKFPPYSSVSSEARDLITQLLNDSKSRLCWPELKQHPFFKTVAWANIRNVPPPYVPSISSLDDTSHFDEVEKPKPPPNLESFQPRTRDFSGRHLPFVGFTFFRSANTKLQSPKRSISNSTVLSDLDSSLGLNTAQYISQSESSTSVTSPTSIKTSRPTTSYSTSDLEVTVTVKICEIKELRGKCAQLEGKVEVLEAEKVAMEKQLTDYISKSQTLQHQLDQEKERSDCSDRESVEVWKDLQAMNSQISTLEDQMLSFQLDELREIIIQLETEQEGLTRRLLQKDRQIEMLQKSLTAAEQQLTSKQLKLDRERRKSREGQKQNLVLFEESWLKQLEEKQNSIDELSRKVRDLEDLVAAYEEKEDEQMGELQQLHYKLNTSLLSTGTDSSSLDLDGSASAVMQVIPDSQNEKKRVSLHVTLRPGRGLVRDNKTVEKLKDLQTVIDRYSKEAQSWRLKEEHLQKKLNKLELDLKSHHQKEGLSQQTKDSLMTKVHIYQQEVHMQRKLIQELQKKMRSYLDEQTTITHTEAKLKDLQCQNLDLEAELFTVKQEAEQTRQTVMDKTREMEEIIGKLESARKQVQEYQNKYTKEVENTDLKTQELEGQMTVLIEERNHLGCQVKSMLDQVESLQALVDEGRLQVESLTERNTQLQRQLQEYTECNADLLKQMESLQKVHKDEELHSTSSSRAELNTQLNLLQQHNDDLQQQLQTAHRERRDLEEKGLTLQRDAERLNRRITRLEGVNAEKMQLEVKLEKLSALEREKKRLEVKLSQQDDLEQEKAQLQLKIERQEMENRALQLDLKEARAQTQELADKYDSLCKEHDAQIKEKFHRSPTSKKLVLDLLRSEKEELERQVKELKLLNLSATELKEELEIKNFKIMDLQAKVMILEQKVKRNEGTDFDKYDLKAKVRSLEDQLRNSESRIKMTAKDRLEEEKLKAELERKAVKISDLQTKIKLLEDEVQKNERKVFMVNDLKTKVRTLEDQLKEKERNAKTVVGTEKQLEKLTAELVELKSQLRIKNSCVERLEKEKSDLVKQVSDKKHGLDRTPSVEVRSRLIERLQSEKAELRRQLEQMEKERDTIRLAKPSRVQSSSSRNSLTILSENGISIRAELEDKVQRLERVVRELEKKLEISSATTVDKDMLKQEIEQLKIQIQETAKAGALDMVPQSQYDSLKLSHEEVLDKVRDLQRKVEQLQDEKLQLEKSSLSKLESEERQRTLEDKVKTLEGENAELRNELSELQQQHQTLQNKLETEKKVTKEEADKPKALKSSASNNRLVGDLMQEKRALEDKVKCLERQLESLQKRRESAGARVQSPTELQEEKIQLEAEVKKLTTSITKLKEENATCKKNQTEAESKVESLELQVKDLMMDSSKLREEIDSLESAARKQRALDSERDLTDSSSQMADLSKTNAYLETKVQELEKHLERANTRPTADGVKISRDTLVAELRKELHESNLAVSEARSLVSAGKRQEKELRDRLDKLQRALDNGAVMRANNVQVAAGAEQELRVLSSKYETLQRQYKNLEDRQNGSHRDKAATVMEVMLLKDQLQTKQHQLDMEMKKSQKLAGLCMELEDQVKDMEAIIAHSESQEAKWNDIRHTYEKAMSEREEELEGANQRLRAVSSARSGVDSRVSQLNEELQIVKSQHKAEVAKLQKLLDEERAKASQSALKLSSFEEKERQYHCILEAQGQNIQAESGVINQLKEELTFKITEVEDLKSTNLKLRKHLDQAMDKFELIFGEKVSLENFTEALQGLHFLEKYKFESTIGQQMKLIDYLQELYMENSGKKKKGNKRPGSARGKDGHPFPGLPLQWTDLQTALEQELKKSAKLQEQLERLREENFAQANELLKLKGPLKERVENKKKLTSHVQNAAVASLVRSPSAQTMAARKSNWHGYQEPLQPTPQRMHHNIPHRFVTGLNTRATKCGLCLGSVHFVKQASKCQECGIVVHPKCASSVPATCGLPTEYVRHFADMMSRIEEAELHSNMEPLNIKMEGWLKVPRTGKPGWEKRWVELDGSYLMLYKEDTDANPVDTFDLSPPDAEVSVHSAVTAAELTSTTSLDLYYVLRLDQDPLTTCWPGRYLYLMTTNFSEKQRWVAALEAAVRSFQRKDKLSRNEPQMTTVLSLKEGDRKEFNCALALSPQIVLLGTDDGLFALNPQSTSGFQHLVQLSGFGSVHQIAEAKGINMVLLLTGPERRLVMVESKLIKCRMSQTIGGETTPFTYKPVEGIQSCTVFDIAMWADASYLCVGMPDKVVLLKYNPSLGMYCIRKEMPSNQPCSCMCMAESFAIVGTERFYRISLEHPSLIDFVDRQDSSLAFAAFGAANHHSFPLAVLQVSPEGLPLEFLLCFHEFGVFVDHRGQRSRQSDIKWSGLPLSFTYYEPFLYITYFNSLQATVVPTDKDQVKGCQTAVDLPAPRNLGHAEELGAVYVASSSNGITEVILLRARDQRKELADSDEEKENFSRQVRFAPSPDKGFSGGFTVKTSVSLLSLDSISSSSTFTSVESTL